MLECVPNVSEGRDARRLAALAAACGRSLLDLHADPDHHRSVFTLAGPGPADASGAALALADAIVASGATLADHHGAHPRHGVLDVVPVAALDRSDGGPAGAVGAARALARALAERHGIPTFLYDAADPAGRTLPATRRDAFHRRAPDFGPGVPHPHLGATMVGARPPLVAINCELDRDDLDLARRIAGQVRESGGGLPGCRALGLRLRSAARVQVSMNLVALERTGVEEACTAVRSGALAAGADVEAVELVGLLPRTALRACSAAFRAWSGLGEDDTIEGRLARRSREGPAPG